MSAEVFKRYEYKYLLDKDAFEKVKPVLDEYMIHDMYNLTGKPYTISNIYYDTENDFLIRNSLSKPLYKEKLRLRSYGIPELDSKVFLEIKKKFKGIVHKRRTEIVLSEAYDFIEGRKISKIREYMNSQVIREIEYFLEIYNLFPKVYLAYDRIAYFSKDSDDLRISFDMNIRSRRYDLRLEKGDYGEKILEEERYLMEIKTSSAIPLWLANLLSELEIKRRSFSKYGTEFRKILNNNDTDLNAVI